MKLTKLDELETVSVSEENETAVNNEPGNEKVDNGDEQMQPSAE